MQMIIVICAVNYMVLTSQRGGLLSPAIKDYSSRNTRDLIAQDFLTLCKKTKRRLARSSWHQQLAPAAY